LAETTLKKKAEAGEKFSLPKHEGARRQVADVEFQFLGATKKGEWIERPEYETMHGDQTEKT